ncbi:pirin family protein [Ulvibacter antarcticus]|uniref:pirin family protein n=1 Tax=Ulvibacter antarcticus TaxID=442714 RepID=UPI000EF9BCBB|nr:pirin family protein [Ulvibacter antarcticus]
MELVTIILSGVYVQKNSNGESSILNSGDVQLMSCGSVISHFEYNLSSTARLNCMQFCFAPKKEDEKPSTTVIQLNSTKNNLQVLVSPEGNKEGLSSMGQDFYLLHGYFKENHSQNYILKDENKGFVVVNIEGELIVNEEH